MPKVGPGSIYQFTMNDIDGHAVPLQKYKGKTLLVVNVASKCGLTPQYEALQSLYKKYHAKGFEILAFPANDFGSQEPGTNDEIKQFCSSKFGVTFPMFSKITVLGEEANPLYKWLLANSDRQGPIEWNFAKFLVDKKGHVIERFSPKITPDSTELVTAVESALKA
jgi:glutathione peroxidase